MGDALSDRLLETCKQFFLETKSSGLQFSRGLPEDSTFSFMHNQGCSMTPCPVLIGRLAGKNMAYNL